MKITGKGLGPNATVGGVILKNGTHKYNIDHKDPLSALELNTLRNLGLISFDETISAEFIAEVTAALNKGTLEVDVDRVKDKRGKTIKRTYKGSTIPTKKPVKLVKKEKESNVPRRPRKSSKTTRKDNDRD